MTPFLRKEIGQVFDVLSSIQNCKVFGIFFEIFFSVAMHDQYVLVIVNWIKTLKLYKLLNTGLLAMLR